MAKNKRHDRLLENVFAIFSSIHTRTTLTVKMVIATVIVGTAMWYAFDVLQAKKLESIFQAQFNEEHSDQALKEKLSFDWYVKAYMYSSKLFISQRNFSEYIETQKWSPGDTAKIRYHRKFPVWMSE